MAQTKKYLTSTGRTIYTFPVLAFPGLVANIYLIDDGERLILVDCGSGLDTSNQELAAGFDQLAEAYDPRVSLAAIDLILITHGHMDHFGGLPFVRQFTDAPVGVHPLDRRVLSNYEERVVVASRHLETFLRRAGVSDKHLVNLMAMYAWAKDRYRSTPVDFTLAEGRPVMDDLDIQVYHVPGHCPGQVCLRVDDILLTADHVLARTTPHQAPESITNHMGLSHYLDSLGHVECLEGITLALGGHEDPMTDLPGRIADIRQLHDIRLEQVLDIAREPRSIAEISQELFGQVNGYHVLLALEEAGAHVEYLYQRGEMVAANVAEIEHDPDPVIQYLRA
jgi:glyoxylase-like metal-dependent hydrolase (beta-lactamase superfamily II)